MQIVGFLLWCLNYLKHTHRLSLRNIQEGFRKHCRGSAFIQLLDLGIYGKADKGNSLVNLSIAILIRKMSVSMLHDSYT